MRRAHPLHGFAIALLLGAGGCAPHEPGLATVPLQYDEKLLEADFPNPGARLYMNDRSAWFLFDTGAGVHTLARWFVDAAGLTLDDSLGRSVRGVDAAGEPVEFTAVREVKARLEDGSSLLVGVALVADFPPVFEELEVGGLINPQLLAGAGRAAALDLRIPELRIEAFERAVTRLGAREVPPDRLRHCGTLAPPIPNLTYGVTAVTEAGDGWLGLDSGAGTTAIFSGSGLLGGTPLEPGGESMGVAGQPRAYRVARGLPLSFGERTVTIDAEVVDNPGNECGPEGLLGMDAIADCAFVLGENRLAIACGSP